MTRGQINRGGEFTIATAFHHNWPFRWKVVVTEFSRSSQVNKSWVVWTRRGTWFGSSQRGQERMDAAVAEAEAFIERRAAQ